MLQQAPCIYLIVLRCFFISGLVRSTEEPGLVHSLGPVTRRPIDRSARYPSWARPSTETPGSAGRGRVWGESEMCDTLGLESWKGRFRKVKGLESWFEDGGGGGSRRMQ